MRRTYAVTVVMQLEEPEALGGTVGELHDRISKQFVMNAIPMRLRDMFTSPVDFALTGVVVTDCTQVMP